MEEYLSFLRTPTEIANANFSLTFSLTTGIKKKLSEITKNEKTKHNIMFILATSKLNIIETLVSQALIDLVISPKEYKTIINENENYEKLKKSIRMIKSSDELNDKEVEKKKKKMEKITKICRIKKYFSCLTHIKC